MHLFSKNVIDKNKKLFIFRINYSKKMKYLIKFFDKTKLKIRKQENKTRVFQNLKKIGKKREKNESIFSLFPFSSYFLKYSIFIIYLL